VMQIQFKTMLHTPGVNDFALPKFHAVANKFSTPQFEQLTGTDPIARKIAVQGAGVHIARPTMIAHQHAPPRPAKHQRRAESRRSAANDDDIVHWRNIAEA